MLQWKQRCGWSLGEVILVTCIHVRWEENRTSVGDIQNQTMSDSCSCYSGAKARSFGGEKHSEAEGERSSRVRSKGMLRI